MTTMTIQKQGAKVTRNGERIEVTSVDKESRRKKKLASHPVRDINQVVLYGYVQLTTQAIQLLMKHNVPVFFMGPYGGITGKLVNDGSRFAKIRHRQLQMIAGNGPQVRRIATQIVKAKLHHQSELLQTLAQQMSQKQSQTLQKSAQGINELRRTCNRSTSLDAVRGYEGKGSAIYFAAIRSLLHPSWKFEKRAYYPPPDPFNAMLSLGYTMLRKDIETAIHLVGLDPYLGCLHEMADNRQSLVYDLMEEFRPLVVDRAALDLVLGNDISPAEFEFTGRKQRPVELGPKLLPLLNNAYETRASDVVFHRPSQSNQQLRNCFELQARIYARVVMGERQEYEGI